MRCTPTSGTKTASRGFRPTTGQVLGWIDLSRLWPAGQRPHRDAVLNGIAYDAQHQRLFVTGKDWPKLFEIRIAK